VLLRVNRVDRTQLMLLLVAAIAIVNAQDKRQAFGDILKISGPKPFLAKSSR
jgi:hypothetical protein